MQRLAAAVSVSLAVSSTCQARTGDSNHVYVVFNLKAMPVSIPSYLTAYNHMLRALPVKHIVMQRV